MSPGRNPRPILDFRPKVEIPGPENYWVGGALASDRAMDHKAWRAELQSRISQAVRKLAKEHDADFNELAKVGFLLVKLEWPKPPRGRPPKDKVSILLRVAIQLLYTGSETEACYAAGVNDKTFRKYRDNDQMFWSGVRDMVADAAKNRGKEHVSSYLEDD